ncbi:serine hydroxymethyltransferase [Candidatus Microgenomates bacterium]|nr:serine hydroxymethyltransferase [Candidatus Microgenomates bacterium]
MDKVQELIDQEKQRQQDTLCLIPSENYASNKVMDAVGSVLMNKYSEGYSSKRYYQGNGVVDELESLTIKKAKKLFGVEHVNVQPYSGSPANSAVLFGLLEPNDKIMGLSLSSGGHLTHGHPNITFSGKFFKSVQFGTDDGGVIDYGEVEKLAKEEKPKLLIIGTTAYPLILDWKRLGEIADLVGAYLVADISHVAGLVVAGVYETPVNDAHVITTTTHKTLRGPRGAMIMVTKKGLKKDPEISKKIDRAVFPGMQGGPHNNTTAGILQALIEAESEDFKKYGQQVVFSEKVLAKELVGGGLTLVTGGTQCHLMVIDLRPQKLSGSTVSEALEEVGIIVNKNAVPNDSAPPFNPSGIRIGTPALTTRGMGEIEMKKIASWILQVVEAVKLRDKTELTKIKKEVGEMCKKFPL